MRKLWFSGGTEWGSYGFDENTFNGKSGKKKFAIFLRLRFRIAIAVERKSHSVNGALQAEWNETKRKSS